LDLIDLCPLLASARAALAELDEGTFTEGQELDRKTEKQVPKEMVGRRLSHEEAKRLLAKGLQKSRPGMLKLRSGPWCLIGIIDLLSIDLDGMDFWIWRALSDITPRVVVIEYNNRFPAEISATVPYDPQFQGTDLMTVGYFGASLAALTKLGVEKGYRLIGTNGPNTNAFFMKDDVGRDAFPAVTVQSCLSSDYAMRHQRSHYPLIKNRPLTFY
jgi:hypothetical protein